MVSKNLVFTIALALQFAYVAGYLKCNNETVMSIWIYIGLADVVLRPEILKNNVGKLNTSCELQVRLYEFKSMSCKFNPRVTS